MQEAYLVGRAAHDDPVAVDQAGKALHVEVHARVAARAFNRIAWPAFAVLILTGVWNVAAERHEVEGAYRATLLVKLAVVLVSGLTAHLHSRATTPLGLAAYGALTGISALAALFLGVLLHS